MIRAEIMDIETLQTLINILKDIRTKAFAEIEKVAKANESSDFTQSYCEGLKDELNTLINPFENIPSQVEDALREVADDE